MYRGRRTRDWRFFRAAGGGLLDLYPVNRPRRKCRDLLILQDTGHAALFARQRESTTRCGVINSRLRITTGQLLQGPPKHSKHPDTEQVAMTDQ